MAMNFFSPESSRFAPRETAINHGGNLMVNLNTRHNEGVTRTPTFSAIALKAGGLAGVVILGGTLLACDGSGVTDVGAVLTAPARIQTQTVDATRMLLERLDHSVVNQHSSAYDSDLPGASIAAYEKIIDPVITSSAARDESVSVRNTR